ncbi:hypothetical protein D3C80_2061790 [compost metagenome]
MHIVIVEHMRRMTIDECCRERIGGPALANQHDIATGTQDLADETRAAIIRTAKCASEKINDCCSGNGDRFC